MLRTLVNPPINCEISVEALVEVNHNGRSVGVVVIPKGPDKPYQTNTGQYLICVGTTNRAASVQELMRLFQQAGVFHVDANPVAQTSIKDVSAAAVDKYLARYGLSLADESDQRCC